MASLFIAISENAPRRKNGGRAKSRGCVICKWLEMFGIKRIYSARPNVYHWRRENRSRLKLLCLNRLIVLDKGIPVIYYHMRFASIINIVAVLNPKFRETKTKGCVNKRVLREKVSNVSGRCVRIIPTNDWVVCNQIQTKKTKEIANILNSLLKYALTAPYREIRKLRPPEWNQKAH